MDVMNFVGEYLTNKNPLLKMLILYSRALLEPDALKQAFHYTFTEKIR